MAKVLLLEAHKNSPISHYLRSLGHSIIRIDLEGETALNYLRSQNYDLAIVDMQMPLMDGYQLVKEIRRDPKLQGLTVFSLSAAPGRAETDEFLRIGCNDYINKPVDTHELQEKINRLVNKIR
jgi:CheY-like chemotaxis protein